MRISDWSSDVCSSDLWHVRCLRVRCRLPGRSRLFRRDTFGRVADHRQRSVRISVQWLARQQHGGRSEEHTSELQSLMHISYAVFCLKKKNYNNSHTTNIQ